MNRMCDTKNNTILFIIYAGKSEGNKALYC